MMAGFTESALSKKLADLNSSQQSIQTLSLWLIHHRKHHAAIVKVWFKDFLKSNASRKLTFMYLANDVIQNSKRKGPEFGKEFGNVLRKAFEHFSLPECDEKTIRNLNRILQVWEERGVYDSKMIKEFKKALGSRPDEHVEDSEPPISDTSQVQDGLISCSSASLPANFTSEPPDREPTPPKKKVKLTPSFVPEVEKPTKKEKTIKVKVVPREHKKSETEVEVDGTKELHVTLSPHTPSGDPPEPEELIKALMELENSASSDAAVRERIASLPPEVSEVSLLNKLEDKATAEKLAVQVNEAVQLLLEYNSRLAAEMEDRKKVSAMMRDFIQAQRELFVQAEQRLEEYKEKLQKVYVVRQEIKSHIQNLPDLTQLPDVTGGLAPLPSAGDLFSMH